jgi:hypothetical protein
MMEDLVEECPDVPEYRSTLVICAGGLARALAEADDLEAAVERHRQCVALNRSLVEDAPSVEWYRGSLTRSLLDLAKTERRLSGPEEARRLIEELLALETGASQSGHRGPFGRALLADAHAELAQVLTDLDEPELAAEPSQKARQFRRPAPPRRSFHRFGPPRPKRRLGAARGSSWPGRGEQASG